MNGFEGVKARHGAWEKKKGFPPPRPPPHFQPSTTFSLALSPAAGKPTSDVCDVPGVCAKVHVNGSQGYLTLLDRLFVPLNRCPAVGWPTSLPIVSRRATVFASWVHTRRSSACCWTYSGKKSSMMSFRSFCPEPTALSDCGSDRTFDSLFPAHMTKILSPSTTYYVFSPVRLSYVRDEARADRFEISSTPSRRGEHRDLAHRKMPRASVGQSRLCMPRQASLHTSKTNAGRCRLNGVRIITFTST